MAAAAEHELWDFLNELVLKLRVLMESVPVHGGVNADVEDLLEELSIVHYYKMLYYLTQQQECQKDSLRYWRKPEISCKHVCKIMA